ncbi:hypothetical protein IFR05_003732 [Cadophora sp. M221]|nr:hypothetical protein IFR05_003732 [Cadophora sp. M221]
MYAKSSLLAVAALATLVAAKGDSGGSGSGKGNGGGDKSKIRIEVGKGGLVFNPNTATAAVGDTVEFHFYPKNHSVTQGNFDSPCGTGSLTNGFFSGYVPSTSEEAPNVFQITIADTNPIWYYCSQGQHCASGMVGVINPPASGNTFAAYMAAAAGSTKATTPAQVQGGSLVSNDESSTKTEDNHSTTTGEDHSSTRTGEDHSTTTTEDHTSTKTEDHSTVTATGAAASITSTVVASTSISAAATTSSSSSSSTTGTSGSSSSPATATSVQSNSARASFEIQWAGVVAVQVVLSCLTLLM